MLAVLLVTMRMIMAVTMLVRMICVVGHRCELFGMGMGLMVMSIILDGR